MFLKYRARQIVTIGPGRFEAQTPTTYIQINLLPLRLLVIIIRFFIYIEHKNDHITHGVGTIYFPCNFSHNAMHAYCISNACCEVDFVSGSDIYGNKIFLRF